MLMHIFAHATRVRNACDHLQLVLRVYMHVSSLYHIYINLHAHAQLQSIILGARRPVIFNHCIFQNTKS
jgi:hypothetical protein